MWFQNRRAKFRRNERSISLQQNNNNKINSKSSYNNTTSSINNNKSELTEQPLYHHQSLIPSSGNSDLQYVMPWKFPHAHYNPEKFYSSGPHINPQTCSFLSPALNYCTSNITTSGLCNRLDMNSLPYRSHDFTLTSPQL